MSSAFDPPARWRAIDNHAKVAAQTVAITATAATLSLATASFATVTPFSLLAIASDARGLEVSRSAIGLAYAAVNGVPSGEFMYLWRTSPRSRAACTRQRRTRAGRRQPSI